MIVKIKKKKQRCTVFINSYIIYIMLMQNCQELNLTIKKNFR